MLYFSPGPIQAEDGDKDILTPLVYSILSGELTVCCSDLLTFNLHLYLFNMTQNDFIGDDNGRFTIDSKTGEISLRQRVENRLLTPSFRLRIMVRQNNLYVYEQRDGCCTGSTRTQHGSVSHREI